MKLKKCRCGGNAIFHEEDCCKGILHFYKFYARCENCRKTVGVSFENQIVQECPSMVYMQKRDAMKKLETQWNNQ